MRNIISLTFLFLSLASFSQRVSFEDPDLTFSFKKPKNWEVFDDGYVVKASPSAQDTASIYFSITYFEDAQPPGMNPFENENEKNSSIDFQKWIRKIAGEKAEYRIESSDNSVETLYRFKWDDQRFELTTKQPSPAKNPQNSEVFNRIIRSIRIGR